MITQINLGEKIRNYRKLKGVSQFDLEMAIGTSSGSISRIENGETNPTKETIISISKVLELQTTEIASLFGIEVWSFETYLPIINKILTLKNLEEVLKNVTDDLVFKMGYIASAIFLVKGDKLFLTKVANSKLSRSVLDHLPKPLAEYFIPLDYQNNLAARAIRDKKMYIGDHTRDYALPAFTLEEANAFEEATGDKSNIIFPLIINDGEPFGVMIFKKKFHDQFLNERSVLQAVVDQVAIAIRNTGY